MITAAGVLAAIAGVGSMVTGFIYLSKQIQKLAASLQPTQDQINQKLDVMIQQQKTQAEQSGRPV